VILSNSFIRNVNALGVLGLGIVLVLGLVMQVVLDELPCPLCLLQRVAFALVMYGFMLNVLCGLRFRHYGIIALGALYGAGVSLRQISLHIVPGTGNYGAPILGLHLYTWAFMLFVATLLAVAILLLFSHPRMQDQPIATNKMERLICWGAVIVVALNVASTFIECGPLVCADNPANYRLLP
jgi:disulfide bond formation protein DsbB